MIRAFKSAVALLLVFGGVARPVSAATVLFADNFNRSTGNVVGSPTTGGSPWVEHNVNSNDVAIVKGGASGASGDNALRIREGTDYARQLNISTLGYTDIQLSFDWEALGPSEARDLLSVGWRIGSEEQSSNPFQMLALFGLGDRPPVWHSVASISLPGADNLGTPPYLQLQFRINVDKKDEGAKIDNVVVTGIRIPIVDTQGDDPPILVTLSNPTINAIGLPEPGSLAVWGFLVIIGVVCGLRRRSA